MRRLAITPRFVNEAGTDLIPGKIHSIRENYPYWKKFEGQDLALFVWEGKPYRSRQKAVCVKRLASVERVYMQRNENNAAIEFFLITPLEENKILDAETLAKNDGFEDAGEFNDWFAKYPCGEMALLHFTDYRH